MKERVQRAILVAIAVALGITVATILTGDEFSLFKTGLSAFVAVIVDYIFTYFFEGKKK